MPKYWKKPVYLKELIINRMEILAARDIETPVSFDILSYRAPFLIEKLLKDAIVENAEEGEQLFAEVKRWMLLVYADKSKIWEMYSFLIDEVWHQFILFTDEYMKFCNFYLGSYFPHYPGNAPGNDEKDQLIGSFNEFQQLYRSFFQMELPAVWFDEKRITTQRRILNYNAGRLFVKEENGGGVNMTNSSGNILLSINLLARDAIAFIAATKAFYVRELPGDLTDEEKIMIVSSLVRFNVLRVAS